MDQLSGWFVGLVLGLTGAGGTVLAVPLLMWGFGWTLLQAAPVALVAVFTATAFGTVAAWDVAYVRYRAALLMGVAAMLTAPLGLMLAGVLPEILLTILFSAVMVLVAGRMWLQARRAPEDTNIVRASVAGEGPRATGPICRLQVNTGRIAWTRPCAACIAGIGAVAGLLAGLLGVGGGFVIVPSLRASSELSMHSAVATSLMAIALISAATVAATILQGRDLPWQIAAPFAACSVGGMFAGRWIAPRIAGAKLQQGFSVLTLLAACALLADAMQVFG